MKKINTKKIVQIGMLIAVQIVLSRFCSISTPIVKIGFGFLPLAMIAMLYGPLCAGTAAATADFLGAVLFPVGAYFPGFTLTAFLAGITYGVFLYNRPKNWVRISCAVLMVALVLSLGLNTVWIWMITGKGYMVLLPTRILKCTVMAPMKVIMIRFAGTKISLLESRANTI